MSRTRHNCSGVSHFAGSALLAGLLGFVSIPMQAQAQGMNMPGMEKGQQQKQTTATGTGTVTAINQANKKVTLDHAPMPAVKWPAMKMEFSTAPSVDLSKVKVGDKVKFTIAGSGNNYTVQSITPNQ